MTHSKAILLTGAPCKKKALIFLDLALIYDFIGLCQFLEVEYGPRLN